MAGEKGTKAGSHNKQRVGEKKKNESFREWEQSKSMTQVAKLLSQSKKMSGLS